MTTEAGYQCGTCIHKKVELSQSPCRNCELNSEYETHIKESVNPPTEVLAFIELLKGNRNPQAGDAWDILKEIFSQGGCYTFYKILKSMFPEAVAYKVDYMHDRFRKGYEDGAYVISHVVTRIGDHYYDIRGAFILENTVYERMAVMGAADHEIADKFTYSYRSRGPVPFE